LNGYGCLESNSYGLLEAWTYADLEACVAPEPGPVVLRDVSLSVVFAGVTLTDVISARGQIDADGGWPTCSVFVTAKPATGNEEDTLTVTAGGQLNTLQRFTGRVRRFRPSAFPKSIEIVGTGTLAYANEWAPAEDTYFDETFPTGATDQALVQWALDQVPGVTYTAANIAGTGITLGAAAGAPEAFDWKAGTTAWNYIQQLDRATLYRTYQDHNGEIRRVKMIGHPDFTEDFRLGPEHILDGATGNRYTEQTRNYVHVRGHDYGDGLGPVEGSASGANDFQGDGSATATRHGEEFSSDLIESGVDIDTGIWDGSPGLRADQIADEIINDVNKEFVEATVPSWRDNLDGPGQTVLLDALARLAIGEKMWLQSYQWEFNDRGWTATYGLTGGGLEQDNPPPPP